MGINQTNTPVDMSQQYSQLGNMMQNSNLDINGINQNNILSQMGIASFTPTANSQQLGGMN
jgi:hypothetical protein